MILISSRARIAAAVLSLGSLASLPAILATPALAAPAFDSAAAKAKIDNFDAGLLAIMKQAKTLGYQGRFKQFQPLIESTFDIPGMTRIVVGSYWTQWTDEQRSRITRAFGDFTVANYARDFDGYSGESFATDGVTPNPNGAVVNTRLIRPHDEPVTLNYLLHPGAADGQPRIVDVFLTGTISELARRRSEFSAVLKRDGYDGLLKTLTAATNQTSP